MKKNILYVLTSVAVAALVLAFSPVSAGADAVVFPTGTYTTTITAEDVAKYGLPSPYPEILIGDWVMTFKADGSNEAINTTTGASGQGVYFTNHAVLIYGKDSGELSCPSPAHAVYKWTANGDTLILKAVSEMSERCWGRFIISTSHPLIRVP